jgi:hypothetical protein
MTDHLAITGTDGACQCCGTREGVRHTDADLGFVCTECFTQLVQVEIGLRQLTACEPWEEDEA